MPCLPIRTPLLSLCLLALMAGGCAGHLGGRGGALFEGDSSGLSASSPYLDLETIEEGKIVHVATGTSVDFEQMMALAADSRIVYVGEMHTNLEDHKIQAAVLREMLRRYPGRVMVGLEMFNHDAQDDLDAWSAGTLPRSDFLRTWYQNWSQDYAYYADILDLARDEHIPLIGLNATRDEVRQVSMGEAEPTPPKAEDPYHRAYMSAVFGDHEHGGGRYYNVQTLWEETMAAGIADALSAPDAAGTHMVVLAGGGHIQYGFGLPRRVFGRLSVSYTTILPITVTLPEGRDDLSMDVEVPDMPLPLADFVWSVPYRDLSDTQLRLGISLDRHKADGLWVGEVMPGSAAAEAGVRAGDRLTMLDGVPLAGLVDLKVVMTGAKAGQSGTLVVMREGGEISLPMTYRTAAEQRQAVAQATTVP